MTQGTEYILRVLCRDEKGIITWITGLISKLGGNILNLEQHSEEDSGLFAMRLHIEKMQDIRQLKKSLKNNNPFKKFDFWTDEVNKQQKMAVLVTNEEPCLYELLIKQKTGELFCDIPLIISNHEKLKYIADDFNIPYFYLPVNPENIQQQETGIEQLLIKHRIDLIVLARYMRVLSGSFVEKYYGKIINIHHGFLPAFKGAKPYHQAWTRGVKMVGATAHYVTEKLDEGHIIHQDAIQITHRHSIKEIIRAGSNLERNVLLEAVRAHLEYRIILIGQRTIIFHF